MAMPVISAEKGKISYTESASYSIEGDFNGTLQQIITFDLGL
jgi:stalled ribosome alternative rescue factor ArfA